MDKIKFDPKNPHIRTFTDKKFFFLDIKPEDICIEDIAHSLSHTCRYGGHCSCFFSVAEHSIRCCDRARGRSIPLWGLLHDAAEAYIGDICKPLKTLLSVDIDPSDPFFRAECYKGIECYEQDILRIIAMKFNLPWPVPQEIHEIDTELLYEEMGFLWGDEIITTIYPRDAEQMFLRCFVEERSRMTNGKM